MVFLFGIGVAGIVSASPLAMRVLEVVSVVYMLWLAWKKGRFAAGTGETEVAVVGDRELTANG